MFELGTKSLVESASYGLGTRSNNFITSIKGARDNAMRYYSHQTSDVYTYDLRTQNRYSSLEADHLCRSFAVKVAVRSLVDCKCYED